MPTQRGSSVRFLFDLDWSLKPSEGHQNVDAIVNGVRKLF